MALKKISKLLTEQEVAIIIRKSVHWLRRARCYGYGGYGIPYRKIGVHVRYDEKDVMNWLGKFDTQIETTKKLKNKKGNNDE